MKWQILRSNAGYRARLVASNGEPIMWSETYDSLASAEYAITLTGSTFTSTIAFDSLPIDFIDERNIGG